MLPSIVLNCRLFVYIFPFSPQSDLVFGIHFRMPGTDHKAAVPESSSSTRKSLTNVLFLLPIESNSSFCRIVAPQHGPLNFTSHVNRVTQRRERMCACARVCPRAGEAGEMKRADDIVSANVEDEFCSTIKISLLFT